MKFRLSMPLRALVHILLALAVACLLVLPDYLYALITGGKQLLFRPYTLGGLALIGFLLLALRNRPTVYGLLTLFFLLQLGQLLHIAYFGTSFAPHEIRLLFTELAEVNESLAGVGGLMVPPLLSVLVSYVALALLFRLTVAYRLHLPSAALPLVFLLLVLPVRAYTTNESQRFYPNPKTYTLENALHAFSYFVGRELPNQLFVKSDVAWQPYTVEKIRPPVNANIIVVMGESLTPAHMSLFGYGRDTTPQLNTLRADKNFIFHQGIAAGIATKVTLPMFFNVTREPGNTRQIYRQTSNLIKMANAQGFLTHYYSAQTSNLSTFSGIEYARHSLTAESLSSAIDEERDAIAFGYLKQVDLSQPNFVVLHQRNSHSPYDRYYPKEYEIFKSTPDTQTNQYRVNTYDNSVRYTDHLLYGLIKDLKSRSRLPVYVLFTSDHGEMLGENGGQFGHGKLTREVAHVPFIFYAYNGDPAIVDKARQLISPTHHEMGRLLADMLGYRIDNPNWQQGVYYLNGSDLSGSDGYLQINKQGAEWSLSQPAKTASR